MATGIIRVTGFTLKLLYQSAYSNPYSAEFTNIAGQINKKLLSIFRIHLGSSVVGIQVYNITNGSLVVDYNVLSNDTSISVSQVQTVANDAVNDSTLASLKPDTDYSRRPSAKGKVK